MHEGVVRLGACVPFAQVPGLLAQFTKVTLSAATARRLTETAGAASVALQDAEADRLVRERPFPVAGAPVQQLSVDGAMVPLVGGTWGEVKTLAIGAVSRDATGAGRTTDLSYFSRRTSAETFIHLATVEVQRRGVERAEVVAGVVDGAEWCQSFLDAHCPQAVRILDFPHAVGYLSQAAQAAFGAGTAATSAWVSAQATELKTGNPAMVLARLAALPPGEVRDGALGYLTPRLAQLRYADFRAAGLPIGSGAVESANKLVVEARLKGAGMHWAEAHVNPMVALRTAVCADRWTATWPSIAARLRAQARRSQPRPTPPPPPPARTVPRPHPAPPPAARPKLVVNGTPTARHPWKRFPAVPPRPATTP